MSKSNSKIVLCVMLTACSILPFGMDIFLSSMPQIQELFSVSNAATMLTAYLLALAMGQLCYGPLFDYFGRKPVLTVGLIIYIVGTLLIIGSSSYHSILVGRFIEGLGACSAAVAAITMVRDSFSQEELTKYIAIVFGIIAVCPVISPVVGSYLQYYFGWQGGFTFIAILSLIYLIVTVFWFRESMDEKNRNALKIRTILSTYGRFIRHREYMYFTLISSCSYAILFAYLAVAPTVYIEMLGFGVKSFGLLFMGNTIVVLIMNFTAPTLAKKIGLHKVVALGVGLLVLGVALLFVLTNTIGLSIIPFFISMGVIFAGIGTIRPTGAAGAMRIFPKKVAGSASALFLFFCFIGGMLTTLISEKMIKYSVNDFVGILAILVVIAISMTILLLKRKAFMLDSAETCSHLSE